MSVVSSIWNIKSMILDNGYTATFKSNYIATIKISFFFNWVFKEDGLEYALTGYCKFHVSHVAKLY